MTTRPTMAPYACPACLDVRHDDCWGVNNGCEARSDAERIDCPCTSYEHPAQMRVAVLRLLPAGSEREVTIDVVRALAERIPRATPERIAAEIEVAWRERSRRPVFRR